MSTAPIARSALTTALVTHMVEALEPTGVLVGRGTAPQDGGWSDGQPGEGIFTPYVTVKARVASPLQADPAGRTRTSWKCDYVLTYTSYKESACDDVADLGRAAVVQMARDEPWLLGGVLWSLQRVDTPRLGATGRNNGTNPPYWDVSDDVSLWLSRVRNQ
jgi:hypothetical protein